MPKGVVALGQILVQTIVSGLLTGLIFSLIAAGLSLIYGVMGIVNFAHGDFLMISMYTAYWLYTLLKVDPLFSTPICVLLLSFVGLSVYRLIISKILHAPRMTQLLATFGLMIFLRSMAQFLFTPDYRLVTEPLVKGRIELFGIFIAVPQVVASIGAMVTAGLLFWFINKTETGTALRATAEDREAASLMGIDSDWMYALAWVIGAACVGVAGALLAIFYYIFPEIGSIFGLIALVTVVLGGVGSIEGAFIGGIIVGLVMVLGGFLVDPAYKYALVFLLYVGVVLLRPQGLLGE